jgi:hypothetical protein
LSQLNLQCMPRHLVGNALQMKDSHNDTFQFETKKDVGNTLQMKGSHNT